MRAAKIGTIMPWGGDGGNGFLASNIPKGWIVLGQGQNMLPAWEYPLLASQLGDTYGGSMSDAAGNHYEFPYYNTPATFGLPNISNHLMVDLEKDYLDDPRYEMGQPNAKNVVLDKDGNKFGDQISGWGNDVIVKTSWQATADIDFTLNISGNLYFKFEDMNLTAPDFLETVYMIPRKLGPNHTPSHSHPGNIPTAADGGTGAMTFRTDGGIVMNSTADYECLTAVNINCEHRDSEPQEWNQGAASIAYYGNQNFENTLPRTSSPWEFVEDSTGKAYWANVPAGAANWRGTDRGSGQENVTYTQNISGINGTDEILATTPIDTHKQPAHTGMHPRPMRSNSRSNFLGYDVGSPVRSDGLVDDPENTPIALDGQPSVKAGRFRVADCIVNGAEITFPANTDIRREYTNGTDTWYQWDRVVPTMCIQTSVNYQKYNWYDDGVQVKKVEKSGNTWKVTTTQDAKQNGTISLDFYFGTYPTSLSMFDDTKNPLKNAFESHNHGSFEIEQTMGSMSGPPSHTATNADGSSLIADSLEDALNINIDSAQPNCTVTFIIKAY